jgi:hypothetical protein
MRVARLFVLPFLSCLVQPVHAQSPGTDLFCNAGLRPDGYIDLSKMPTPPAFPALAEGSMSSPAFTVTLPVAGISGLTVQLSIPKLQSLQPGPIYSVVNGALMINGQGANNGEVLELNFNQPVAGFGLVANSVGRQSDFTLQTDAPGSAPPNFSNSGDTLTVAPKYYSIPLQQVDLQGGFTTAYVLFTGSTDFGTPSVANLRVQSVGASNTTAVPKNGLQQWLVSESVQSPFAGDAASWPDQSGNHHPAKQTAALNQPIPVQGDGNACQSAFAFEGNQYFTFQLPINGWQQMTLFLVAKASGAPPAGSAPGAAAAIFWNENAMWGNTFVAPWQATETFRFGTTQAANQPVYFRPTTVGEDFTITRAVHDGNVDSLYVNGLQAVYQENKLPVLSGTTGTGYIGRGLGNTYFRGEIGEILI